MVYLLKNRKNISAQINNNNKKTIKNNKTKNQRNNTHIYLFTLLFSLCTLSRNITVTVFSCFIFCFSFFLLVFILSVCFCATNFSVIWVLNNFVNLRVENEIYPRTQSVFCDVIKTKSTTIITHTHPHAENNNNNNKQERQQQQ